MFYKEEVFKIEIDLGGGVEYFVLPLHITEKRDRN